MAKKNMPSSQQSDPLVQEIVAELGTQSQPAAQPSFVAEPIFEVAPTPEFEIHTAAHLLDPVNVEAPPEVSEKYFKLSEQEREQLVYGVEMGNPASYVAECFGTDPEVVIFAVHMAHLAKQEQL